MSDTNHGRPFYNYNVVLEGLCSLDLNLTLEL